MDSPIRTDIRCANRLFYSENDEDIELDYCWTPPRADLIKKMVAQIELYLSDENLAKDAFLLKHVRRNTMGYVNIKLLTSFKKMKNLSKDWRITAYALKHHSSKLEVNQEGTKVRRKDPVPDSLLAQVPSRLLLVWNVPDQEENVDHSSHGKSSSLPGSRSLMDKALCILEPFGSICTVRLFKPGRELPSELQRYTYRHPELCSQDSVLVEYEDLEGASRAYSQLSQSDSSIKVLLVGKTSKKKAELESGGEERHCGKGEAIVNRRMGQLQLYSRGDDYSSAHSSSESDVTSCSPLHMPRFSAGGQVCSSPWNSPRSSPRILHAPLPVAHRVSPLLAGERWASPDTSPELCRRSADQNLPDGVSWVQRRKLVRLRATVQDDGRAARQGRLGPKRALPGESLPPGVLRFPHGPDGTRGFSSFTAQRLLKI